MEIQIISDLHQEFWSQDRKISDFVARADVLVVAGDLAVGSYRVSSALVELAKHYKDVIYVAGNHEYYNSVYEDFKPEIPSNVHFLNPGTIKIQDVTFIGATLWTNFRRDELLKTYVKRAIADFTRIGNFSANKCAQISELERQYIKMQYENTPGKKVIVTHFIPAEAGISKFWKERGGELNKYFANDLDNWIETLEDTTWIFGHTHDKIDTQLGDTRFIANPYGYHGHETVQITKQIIRV